MDAIQDFLGYELNTYEEKDVLDKRLDLVYEQMPDDILGTFYEKYGIGRDEKIIVKTWCETTNEGEAYLRFNGYKNAKRIGETPFYEVSCIGLPLRDVEITDTATVKPLSEIMRSASARLAESHSTNVSPAKECYADR